MVDDFEIVLFEGVGGGTDTLSSRMGSVSAEVRFASM